MAHRTRGCPVAIPRSQRAAIDTLRQREARRLDARDLSGLPTGYDQACGLRLALLDRCTTRGSVAARSAMSREFVTFLEKDVAVLVTSVIGIVASVAILLWYDVPIGALTASIFFRCCWSTACTFVIRAGTTRVRITS